MSTATTSLSLSRDLLRDLSRVAKAEHRTKSGLIQEAVRFYLEAKQWKRLQRDMAYRARKAGVENEDDVERLIDSLRR